MQVRMLSQVLQHLKMVARLMFSTLNPDIFIRFRGLTARFCQRSGFSNPSAPAGASSSRSEMNCRVMLGLIRCILITSSDCRVQRFVSREMLRFQGSTLHCQMMLGPCCFQLHLNLWFFTDCLDATS